MNINPLIDLQMCIFPKAVSAGEQITLTAMATNKLWRRNTVYSFSAIGAIVVGTGRVATINTSRLKPGTYIVKAHCAQGPDPVEAMDTTGTFTVKGF